jgi:hypothetical protein
METNCLTTAELSFVFDVLHCHKVDLVVVPFSVYWSRRPVFVLLAGDCYDVSRVVYPRRRVNKMGRRMESGVAVLTGGTVCSGEVETGPNNSILDNELGKVALPFLCERIRENSGSIAVYKGTLRFKVPGRRFEWGVRSAKSDGVLFESCLTVE